MRASLPSDGRSIEERNSIIGGCSRQRSSESAHASIEPANVYLPVWERAAFLESCSINPGSSISRRIFLTASAISPTAKVKEFTLCMYCFSTFNPMKRDVTGTTPFTIASRPVIVTPSAGEKLTMQSKFGKMWVYSSSRDFQVSIETLPSIID